MRVGEIQGEIQFADAAAPNTHYNGTSTDGPCSRVGSHSILSSRIINSRTG